jgi:hypothetical protein
MLRALPKTFRRDITILLVGKLILLTALFFFCFSPKSRPRIDSEQMTDFILPPKEKAPNVRP